MQAFEMLYTKFLLPQKFHNISQSTFPYLLFLHVEILLQNVYLMVGWLTYLFIMCLCTNVNEICSEASKASFAVCTAVSCLCHLEMLIQSLHCVFKRLTVYLEGFQVINDLISLCGDTNLTQILFLHFCLTDLFKSVTALYFFINNEM